MKYMGMPGIQIDFEYDGHRIVYEKWDAPFEDARMTVYSRMDQNIGIIEVWDHAPFDNCSPYKSYEKSPMYLVEGFKQWCNSGYRETTSIKEFFHLLFGSKVI